MDCTNNMVVHYLNPQEQDLSDSNTPPFIPQDPNLPDPNTTSFIPQEQDLPDSNIPTFISQELDVSHPIEPNQLSIFLELPAVIIDNNNNTQEGWDDWESETHGDSDYVEEEEEEHGMKSDVSLDAEDIRVIDETQVSTDEENDVESFGDMYKGRRWSLEPDGKIKLLQWDLFANKQQLMDAVRDYSVQEGKYLTQLKSSRYRFTAQCSHQACDWRIHSSVLQDGRTFQIKTLKGTHDWTCPLLMDNPSANSRWVFKKLLPLFKTDPKLTAKDIKKELMTKYGLQLKKHVIRAAKDLLKVAVEGRHDDSYAKLASYVEMVRITNPGSVAFIQWDAPNPSNLDQDPSPRFKRIFISLAGMIQGFKKGCRPLIGVDGCHLKGPFGGVILTAIGLDGDNHCFPLAYGIAENESNESWGWFFTALLKVVGVDEHKWYTVMSDMCKGVMNACKIYFPDASRRVCMVHLERNMIRKWGGSPEMLQLMWGAANAYTDWEYLPFMNELEHRYPEAYVWLLREPMEHWCRHKYLHKTCAPDNTSNWVESFNNVIGELRDKPILFLLEGIRKHIQSWVAERLDNASKWTGHLVPSVVDTLRVHRVRAYQCEIVPNGHWKFDVYDTYNLVNYTKMVKKYGYH